MQCINCADLVSQVRLVITVLFIMDTVLSSDVKRDFFFRFVQLVW